jgi:hypothetical protein
MHYTSRFFIDYRELAIGSVVEWYLILWLDDSESGEMPAICAFKTTWFKNIIFSNQFPAE